MRTLSRAIKALVIVALSCMTAGAHELRTGDGLRLVIDAQSGDTSALELDGENLLREPGGLYVEDFAAGSDARAVHAEAAGGEGEGKEVQLLADQKNIRSV